MSVYVLLFAGLVNLALGLYVYLKRRASKLNVSFAILSLFLGIWIINNFVLRLNNDIFILRSSYSLGALIGVQLVIWSYRLARIRLDRFVAVLYYGAALIFVSLSHIGGLIIEDFSFTNEGLLDIQKGPVFSILSIFIILMIGFALKNLVVGFLKASGIQRQQLRYVLIAVLTTGLLIFLVSFILPLVGVNEFILFDSPSSLIFTIAISYAITRYRLMNIRRVITKSILYFLLTSLITSFFAFTLFISTTFEITSRYSTFALYLAISFIVVVALGPLRNLLAKVTDDIFFKDKIDYQKVLQTMSIAIAKEIDLEILLGSLRTITRDELKIKVADILVKKETAYTSTSQSGKSFALENPLVRLLASRQDALITDEFYYEAYESAHGEDAQAKELVAQLEREGVEFTMPVYLEGDLKAIIILGEKQSGDPYTVEDVRFFTSLSPQIAVAIEKAQLYESVGEFNLQLQDRINKATRELKDTNIRLSEANVHLKQLDKAKSEFLSIASHQLRTPISAVKGYLSMLLEGDFGTIEEKQRKVIKDLFESASRLARLINIFLNVSRIESGRFKLDKADVNINDLIESVMHELKGQAEAKNLTLTFTPWKHKTTLYVDSDKVREVILNLVDNAIKYTQQGEITIRTYEKESEYFFEIKDHGIGIRKEDVQGLFKKFVRGTGIAQVNTQGSGLGLYIANRVITEHGGRIWAESEGLHKGSAFIFALPLGGKAPKAEKKKYESQKSQAGESEQKNSEDAHDSPQELRDALKKGAEENNDETESKKEDSNDEPQERADSP